MNKLLIFSLFLIVLSDYAHLNLDLSDSGHFVAGGLLMLGISGVWRWAKLRSKSKDGASVAIE